MKARARLAATLQLGLGLVALVLETVRVSSTFHEVTLSTFGEGFYCGAAFLAAGLLHLLLLGGDKQLHQVGRDDNSRILPNQPLPRTPLMYSVVGWMQDSIYCYCCGFCF